MINDESSVRIELENLKEEKYQKFASLLIPGCNNLIGVRIPRIRKIAKRIAKDNPITYLNETNDIYFEETMLKAFIIGNMKADIDVVLSEAEKFIPKITNWSLCDSFCSELKIVRNNREVVYSFLEKYWKSKKTYEIRTAVVLLLFHYIVDEYIDKLYGIFDYIKHDDYYVKMSVAWAVSICFVKYPQKTMDYLKNNKLDKETYNKALQKIRESRRVGKETKAIIKGMKRS
ncbi:DNA alkylation repair protein [Clostridium oceanicum]|uniref:DNA alkylation repair protein n=1 Tax=Clostridium oceanicum TaxID=1543 RepID=A0ABN1JK41_9CLOT